MSFPVLCGQHWIDRVDIAHLYEPPRRFRRCLAPRKSWAIPDVGMPPWSDLSAQVVKRAVDRRDVAPVMGPLRVTEPVSWSRLGVVRRTSRR